MQLDDAATILSHADFFEVCDAEQRRLLAFASERKKYRPGSIIYKSGDVPDGATFAGVPARLLARGHGPGEQR